MTEARTHLALLLLPIALSTASTSTVMADAPTRLEVQMAVNQTARGWVLDPDNHHLTVERLKMPQAERELGFVCGAIIPIGRPAFDTDQNSYSAPLYLKDGKIDVGAMAVFFMDVDEALQQSSCQ